MKNYKINRWRIFLKHEKYVEYLKRTLPECEEVECKKCGKKYCDDFNLKCFELLDMCLLCANRNIDIKTIERVYNAR